MLIEECNCECHSSEHVMHCVPCCSPCSYCGKNIRYSPEQHEKQCSLNPVNLIPDWNARNPEKPFRCHRCESPATTASFGNFVCSSYPQCEKSGASSG